jgi:hypothetical protein
LAAANAIPANPARKTGAAAVLIGICVRGLCRESADVLTVCSIVVK